MPPFPHRHFPNYRNIGRLCASNTFGTRQTFRSGGERSSATQHQSGKHVGRERAEASSYVTDEMMLRSTKSSMSQLRVGR